MSQTKAQLIDGKVATVEFSGGSASAPSIAFSGDTNTGIYSPGADQVAISTNGSARLFVDASGNVGIGGIPTAYGALTVFSSGIGGHINSTSGAAGINFYENGTGRFSLRTLNGSAGLSFYDTFNSTERVRITSAGLVGIGTSSPSARLHVYQTGGTQAGLIETDQSASVLNFKSTGQASGQPQVGCAGSDMILNTNGAERLRIDSSGRVGIGTTPGSILSVSGASQITHNYTGASGSLAIGQFNTSGDASINVTVGANLLFATNNTERARVDSSGRLLVGTSSARTNFFNSTGSSAFQVEGTTLNTAVGSIVRSSADAQSSWLVLGKSRGATVGSNTVVQSGDNIGIVSFQATDGTNFQEAAQIGASVDGTPGANDMPGRLVFSTTADGASSPTERMRIQSDGPVLFANCSRLYPATDNATSLGTSGFRFSAVWAANGTIQTSDKRAKTNVTTASLGSDFIKSLRPVSYKWIEGGKRDTGERDKDNNYIYESVPGTRTHWGFIAQEVKEAVDAAGVDFGGWVLTDKDDPDSQQALRYDQFIAPLTKALQEALEKIETLEAKVAALEGA